MTDTNERPTLLTAEDALLLREMLDKIAANDPSRWHRDTRYHQAATALRSIASGAAVVVPSVAGAAEPVAEVVNWNTKSAACFIGVTVNMLKPVPVGTKLYASPQPSPAPLSADAIYEAIKHGDADNQKWLRDKLDELFERVPQFMALFAAQTKEKP